MLRGDSQNYAGWFFKVQTLTQGENFNPSPGECGGEDGGRWRVDGEADAVCFFGSGPLTRDN